MAVPSYISVSVLLLSSLLFLPDNVTGKPSVYAPPPMYPYTLSYRLGEFQGTLFYGAPEGTAVAVKGTLGHEGYHPLYIGVDVKKTEERQTLNPFLNRNSIHSDDHSDKNKTQIVTPGMQMVVSGTTAFTVNSAGDILMQRSDQKHRLRATIYFCVVLVQTDDGAIRSNPLSFVVEIVENSKGDHKNKNAITAGVLVLLILFIGAVTGIVMKCCNCRSDNNLNKSTSSGSDEDVMDSKDHYHIKAEDAIIMGKDCGNQNEGPARDGVKGRPRLVRTDSTLSWLKLHLHDEDDRDSVVSSLPTISENYEDTKIDMNIDFTDNKCNGHHIGTSPTTIDHSKSILGHQVGTSPTTIDHSKGILGHHVGTSPTTIDHSKSILGHHVGTSPTTIDPSKSILGHHVGTSPTTIDHNKSILKKPRRNSRHSQRKRKNSKVPTSSDVGQDSIVNFVEV